MKLAWGAQNIVLSFHENEVLVLTIEKPRTFASLLQNFCWQCDGEDGELVLSENDALIPMTNNIFVVWNPLLTDVNEKKILNKLYQEMKKISDEECYQVLGEVYQTITQYLNGLSMKIPYAISFNESIDSQALYKLCNVKMDDDEVDLLQRLIEYVKISGLLCNVKIIVFINLKAYLDESQLLELYKIAFYYKIRMLLIEDVQRDCLESEKHFILDQDDCFIEL